MTIRGAKAWVDYLDKVELPILSKTIKSICTISEADDVKIEELVKVILQDADLTSKVLKLANSACYNPMRVPTLTMSRSIVQVGFESIKAIAISSALVDQLTQKNNQRQLFNCLVRSFHAAVQAKYLASDMTSEEQEAIFIAALLYDVGEAAFWSCSSNTTQKLEEALSLQGNQFIDDQKEILGTSFKSISRGLSKVWGLGGLHEESLSQAGSRSARIVCAAVELAHRHSYGWEKETLNQLIPVVASLTDRSATQIRKDLSKNAEQAAQLAEKFGIKGASRYLKQKKKVVQLRPNPQSQFEALLKISEYQNSPTHHFDGLLTMILEAVHFSVGLERVALFIAADSAKNSAKPSAKLSPKQSSQALQGKRFQIYRATGKAVHAWQGQEKLYVKPNHPMFQPLTEKQSCLINRPIMQERTPDSHCLTAPFDQAVPALFGPVFHHGRCLAFLYADRQHQHEISNEQLCSFRLFVQQVQSCFERKYFERVVV